MGSFFYAIDLLVVRFRESELHSTFHKTANIYNLMVTYKCWENTIFAD